MIAHAGCMALWRPGAGPGGGWRAALIEGPSGVGKSDLALRLLSEGFRLVSDDRTSLWLSNGQPYAAAPPPIAGLIEARGVGVLPLPPLRMARVALVVRCGEDAERLPDPESTAVCGVQVPVLRLDPLQTSAPVKLRFAITLGAGAR